jgi:hypothetical protein
VQSTPTPCATRARRDRIDRRSQKQKPDRTNADRSSVGTMGRDADGAITRSPYNADLESHIPLPSSGGIRMDAIFRTFQLATSRAS